MSYWYRQGDARLPPPTLLGDSGLEQIRDVQPGTAVVRLDGRGRLLSLQVKDVLSGSNRVTDLPSWQRLFDSSPETLDRLEAEVDDAIAKGEFAELDPDEL